MAVQTVRRRQFVGRSRELAALVAARTSSAQSRGAFVLVSGEAGIGKTRLVAEFLQRLDRRRARFVIRNRVLPACATTARTAAIAAIRARADHQVRAASNDHARRARSTRTRTPSAQPRNQRRRYARKSAAVRCGRRFSPVRLRATRHDRNRRGYPLGRRIDAGVSGRVGACDRLDAFHDCRDASFRRTRHECRPAPLAIAVAAGTGVASPRADAAGAPRDSELLDDVASGRERLPEGVVKDIERLSDGNPFFAEELVNDYIDRSSPSNPPGCHCRFARPSWHV